MKIYTAVILSIISGLLLGVSINYSGLLWFLSLISIIPFFYVLYKYVTRAKQAFLLGWLFGSVFLGTVLIWFWNTLPLDWLGVNSTLFGITIVFFSWASLTIVLAFFFGLTFYLFQRYKRGDFSDVLLISIFWVLFEYLRMWGYALLTFSNESLFGPHFSVGFVGYALSGNKLLLQLAGVGGVYLLSLIVVLVNVSVYWILFRLTFSLYKKIIFVIFIVIFFFSFLLISDMFVHTHTVKGSRFGDVIKVAVLHTNFPTTNMPTREHISIIETLFGGIKNNNENPDIVILPEDSRFIYSLKQDNRLHSFMYSTFGNKEVLVIDSSKIRDKKGAIVSKMEYYNTKSDVITTDEKQFLMPYGEYIPSIYKFLFALFGQSKFIEDLSGRKGHIKGDDNRVVVAFKGVKVGALFCSEILSPSMYKTLARKNSADILVNLSSQAWFHGSKVLYNQTRAMAQVRAVESNLPFIQAGNWSPSFVIDNNGNIIKESTGEYSVLYQNIYIPHTQN